MSPDDMQRFEIYGIEYGYEIRIAIRCKRPGCFWNAELDETTTLAELVQRGEEHAEVCR